MSHFINIYTVLVFILMLIPISSMGSEKPANTTDEQWEVKNQLTLPMNNGASI